MVFLDLGRVLRIRVGCIGAGFVMVLWGVKAAAELPHSKGNSDRVRVVEALSWEWVTRGGPATGNIAGVSQTAILLKAFGRLVRTSLWNYRDQAG